MECVKKYDVLVIGGGPGGEGLNRGYFPVKCMLSAGGKARQGLETQIARVNALWEERLRKTGVDLYSGEAVLRSSTTAAVKRVAGNTGNETEFDRETVLDGKRIISHEHLRKGIGIVKSSCITGVETNDNGKLNVRYTGDEVSETVSVDALLTTGNREPVVPRGLEHWSENIRALTTGNTGGFVKVLTDTSGNTLLGAHIVGQDVAELISMLLPLYQNKHDLRQYVDVFPPDTVSISASAAESAAASNPASNPAQHYFLFASCTRYLESILAQEIEELGGENIKETRAGVSCTGSLETAYTLCLWSRTASRILLKLAEGEVDSEEDLYTLSSSVRWDDHFDVKAKFSVSASASHPVIKNDRYAALKIKDGIADYFRDSFGSRPTVDTERPEIRIYGRIEKATATLYIDLAGESLHKRGYRLEKNEAPLRETTAAAILYKAGWPEIARKGGTCMDPMCGSGTIIIEAALMAFDIAPGVLRGKFGFEKWKKHDAGVWERLKNEALRRKTAGIEAAQAETVQAQAEKCAPIILGSDKDRSAVAVCRENLRRAGVEKMVQVRESDFRELIFSKLLKNSPCEGLIAVNPPYGIRLEDQAGVRPLYSDLGSWMSSEFPGFKAVVLTAGKEAAKYLGLRADKINVFYNGPVKGALAFFELGGNNIFREYGASGDETSGVQAVANRIRKNRKKLKKYLKKHGISCYRVYDADIPQYSAAVDVYEDTWFVVQEYAPPKTVDPQKAEIRLKEILEAVEICFETTSETIFLKQRRRQRREGQYEKKESRGSYNIVREGGLQFFTDFSHYIDTGIFLDHRLTRDLVRKNAEGRRVLNLFAYTCTASVYAVDGGAESVTSVDASSTYLEWGKKNFQLNNIPVQKHSFIRQDAMEFLQAQLEKNSRERKQEHKFGLIFIDPPTFSNRKDSPVDFEVQRDHETLIKRAAELLETEGLIIFSNNFRRFVFSPELKEIFTVREVSAETIPADFERNTKIHGTWLIQKNTK